MLSRWRWSIRGWICILGLGVSTGLQAAGPVQKPHVEAELVSEVSQVRPGLPAWVGLRIKLEPGWHVYWKNPGDSGLRPSLDWQLPEGIQAGPIEWPTPRRIPVGPLVNYGYEGQVLLMSRLEPSAGLRAPGKLALRARAEWLVCRETCIPGRAELELELPVRASDPSFDATWHPLFEKTRMELPEALPPGLQVSAQVGKRELILQVSSAGGPGISARDAEFFPADDSLIENAHPAGVSGGAAQAELRLARGPNQPARLERVRGVLAFASQGKAYEVDVPAQPVAASPLPTMLLFALLGGLLLNIMPCVFPVLGVKVLGFVENAGQDPAQVRAHGLVFSLGTLLSFWALLAVLLGLRAAGQELGWGFQLQSPGFVAFLVLLFFGFSLNLLGVFEVGTRLMGLGGSLFSRGGYAESFFAGVLATLVATPCSAPFMGAALGFALGRDAWTGFLVFTALGVGMLAPYLLLSCFPAWVRKLPRPGRWMETTKQLLAFPLLGTVLWLVWVFGQQTGVDGVVGLVAATLVVGAAAWTWGRWPDSRVAAFCAAGLLAAGVALSAQASQHRAEAPGPSAATGSASGDAVAWQEFSPQRLETLLQEKKPVFVDFTAAWCVTCKVNERVVFGSAEVRTRFRELGLVPLKADWTRRDPEITRTLARYGRSGVPLYLYFPAGKSEPWVFPEIITPGLVLDRLAGAKP